jgi:integrase/recombinase XerC
MKQRLLGPRIQSYLNYYAAGDSHTAKAKRLDVTHFLSFLQKYRGYGTADKLSIEDWDKSSVERFIESRLAHGEAPATVARRLATLKHMGRTLSEQIENFQNPTKEVRPPKQQALKPHTIPPLEIETVKTHAEVRISEKNGAFTRVRNRMLFLLLLDTGLRADEVRLLTRGQLTDDLEWLQNVRTKSRRYRNVYITSAVRTDLEHYLSRRETELKRFFSKLTLSSDNSLPLFISSYGADAGKPLSFRMGAKSVWRAINELSNETHLHPHILRHSYALELLENSHDIRLVAQALGHSDVKITMRYTEQTDSALVHALESTRRGKRRSHVKDVDQDEERDT